MIGNNDDPFDFDVSSNAFANFVTNTTSLFRVDSRSSAVDVIFAAVVVVVLVPFCFLEDFFRFLVMVVVWIMPCSNHPSRTSILPKPRHHFQLDDIVLLFNIGFSDRAVRPTSASNRSAPRVTNKWSNKSNVGPNRGFRSEGNEPEFKRPLFVRRSQRSQHWPFLLVAVLMLVLFFFSFF